MEGQVEGMGVGSVGSAVVCGGSQAGSRQLRRGDRGWQPFRGSVVYEEDGRVESGTGSGDSLRCSTGDANGLGRPKRSLSEWKVAKFKLRLRLDVWARIITFRAEVPGEMFPPLFQLEEGRRDWRKGHYGGHVNGLMSEFVEIERAVALVPELVRGIWIRMYGGRSVMSRTRAIKIVAGDCDARLVAEAVNRWESELCWELGLI